MRSFLYHDIPDQIIRPLLLLCTHFITKGKICEKEFALISKRPTQTSFILDDNWFLFASCAIEMRTWGLFESLDKIAFIAMLMQFQNMRGNGMRVILVQILIQWPWTDCFYQNINWTTFLLLTKRYLKIKCFSSHSFEITCFKVVRIQL